MSVHLCYTPPFTCSNIPEHNSFSPHPSLYFSFSSRSRATRFRWHQPAPFDKQQTWAIDNVCIGDGCIDMCSGHGRCIQGNCVYVDLFSSFCRKFLTHSSQEIFLKLVFESLPSYLKLHIFPKIWYWANYVVWLLYLHSCLGIRNWTIAILSGECWIITDCILFSSVFLWYTRTLKKTIGEGQEFSMFWPKIMHHKHFSHLGLNICNAMHYLWFVIPVLFTQESI